MKTSNINYNNNIELRHLELIRLRIGYLNKCEYSIDLHYNELKNFGETDLRLTLISVWNEVPHFSNKECSLFALTDYIINPNNNENLDTIYPLLKPHFTETQITNLTQAIKQIDLWTRSMKHSEKFK